MCTCTDTKKSILVILYLKGYLLLNFKLYSIVGMCLTWQNYILKGQIMDIYIYVVYTTVGDIVAFRVPVSFLALIFIS